LTALCPELQPAVDSKLVAVGVGNPEVVRADNPVTEELAQEVDTLAEAAVVVDNPVVAVVVDSPEAAVTVDNPAVVVASAGVILPTAVVNSFDCLPC